MGVGVEVEDGVGGPAGRSDGEGAGEEVDEDTEEWLIPSTRTCRQRRRPFRKYLLIYIFFKTVCKMFIVQKNNPKLSMFTRLNTLKLNTLINILNWN